MWLHTSPQDGSAWAALLMLVALAAKGAGNEVLGRAPRFLLGVGWSMAGVVGESGGSEAIPLAAGRGPSCLHQHLDNQGSVGDPIPFSTPIAGGGATWPWAVSIVPDRSVPRCHSCPACLALHGTDTPLCSALLLNWEVGPDVAVFLQGRQTLFPQPSCMPVLPMPPGCALAPCLFVTSQISMARPC